jgi:hypothetical protein
MVTKTDRVMEDTMLAVAGDAERVDVLGKARAFKRTWLELAEALTRVHERNAWERWGFDSFETYCRTELHLKRGTVEKLLGSFRFLETRAPKVLERNREAPTAPVPSLQAVDFVMRAADRGAADSDTMREMERAAFDEGVEAPLLSRRFKEVAFPVDDAERRARVRGQLSSTARRLANLIADADAAVPHEIAVTVEEALGQLLDALDAAA